MAYYTYDTMLDPRAGNLNDYVRRTRCDTVLKTPEHMVGGAPPHRRSPPADGLTLSHTIRHGQLA